MGIWLRAGTASAENGAALVTGNLTLWGNQVMAGDLFRFLDDSVFYEVGADADLNTAFPLATNYAGTTKSSAAYEIVPLSPRRGETPELVARVNAYLNSVSTLVNTTGKPSNSFGANGWLAIDQAARVMYRKNDGVWNDGTFLGGAGYTATSESEVTISGPGEYTFAVSLGTAYVVGQPVVAIAVGSDPLAFVAGRLVSYDEDGFTIDGTATLGSGTYSNWAMSLTGEIGPKGDQGNDGWSPVFATASDGSRRVLRIVDWQGGAGSKPATGLYLGASGFVADIADGVDFRGIQGIQGNQGNQGWSPSYSLVSDGERRVLRVVDWQGGAGTKPTTGLYVGPTGMVEAIGDGVDVRGPQGLQGPQGASYAATSLSEITIGLGDAEFELEEDEASLSYQGGERVRASAASDHTNWVEGINVIGAGTMTITVDKVGGSGTFDDWKISIAGEPGLNGDGAGSVNSADGGLELTGGGANVRIVDSGVAPGTYQNATVTVDIKGRITAAAHGDRPFIIARIAATGNIDLEDLEDGFVVDGVTVEDGDVAILPAQTDPTECGAYLVPLAGPATRVPGLATFNALSGVYFSVMEGTENGDTLWRCTSNRGGEIGVDHVVIEAAQFGEGKLPKDGSEAMTGPLVLTEDDAPATPASGTLAIYAKTDGRVYRKDSAGVEAELGAGSGGDHDALAATLGFMAMQLADVINFAQFPSQDRFADSFDDLTYVDVAGATNLDTGTAGVLKPSATAGSDQLPTMTGATTSGVTISASSDAGGAEAWRAHDKTTTIWQPTNPSVGTPAVWTADFGSGNAKTIGSFEIKNGNNTASRAPANFTLSGSNDGSNFSVIATPATQGGWSLSEVRSFPVTSPASYRYYRFTCTGAQGGSTLQIDEINLISAGVANNLTVRTAGLLLSGTPEIMSGLLLVREVNASTPNTDLLLDFSRNDGSNWISAPLTLIRTVPIAGGMTLKLYGTNHIDMTGHSFSTACRARMRTANNKMVEMHGLFVYGV